MNITIFDFDDTLCKGQSINGFIKYLLRKSNLKYTIKYYLRKLIIPYKSNQYPQYKEFLLKTFVGLDEKFFEDCAKEYAIEVIENKLYPEVLIELKKHLNCKNHIIMSSGGFEIYLKHIAEELNFDCLFATKLRFNKGKFTGEILGYENLDGEKVNNFKRKYKKYDVLEIYTDSINDMPLIEISTKVNIVVRQGVETDWIREDWNKIKV